MKKIILATVLLVALISPVFADGKSDARKLLNELKAALNAANLVQRSSTLDYNKATFSFNGQSVSAFYDAEDGSLIGFSRHIKASELPDEAAENIATEYAGWTVTDVIMFLGSNAHMAYFAEVTRGNNHIALRIMPNGNVSIYNKIPS